MKRGKFWNKATKIGQPPNSEILNKHFHKHTYLYYLNKSQKPNKSFTHQISLLGSIFFNRMQKVASKQTNSESNKGSHMICRIPNTRTTTY
jgi:hypothetical protein